MSDTDEAKSPTEYRSREAKGDHEVGYCRPPIEHRFKPNNNANPKGRKKNTRNRKLVVREVLFEPVTVRSGTETKQMPAIEAVLKKMLSNALAGDHKAGLAIIGIAQREGILTPDQVEAVEGQSDNDRAIMEDVMKRLGTSQPDQSSEIPVDVPTPSEGG
jgi:hypothetical protein